MKVDDKMLLILDLNWLEEGLSTIISVNVSQENKLRLHKKRMRNINMYFLTEGSVLKFFIVNVKQK